MKPKRDFIIKHVNENQKYFWTEQWQENLKRSKDSIQKGEIQTFNNVEELLEDLGFKFLKENQTTEKNT